MTERDLWLVLLGASLASNAFKTTAISTLHRDDAPDNATGDAWAALSTGSKEIMAGALKVPCNGSKLIDAILEDAHSKALVRYCEKTVKVAEFAKGLAPNELLDVLDVAASKIRAKLAAAEKVKTGETK